MRKLISALVAARLRPRLPLRSIRPSCCPANGPAELDNCGGGGSETTSRLSIAPKLQAGEDNSTPSYLFGFASGTVRKRAPTRGSKAPAAMSVIRHRPREHADEQRQVPYPHRQAGASQLATDFVTFTGSFTNFVGLDGCTVEVRGAASRLSRYLRWITRGSVFKTRERWPPNHHTRQPHRKGPNEKSRGRDCPFHRASSRGKP